MQNDHRAALNCISGSDDARLTPLATEATAHIGVEYKPIGLGLFVRDLDAEVTGGPSGDAGDIWFEVRFIFTCDEETRKSIAPKAVRWHGEHTDAMCLSNRTSTAPVCALEICNHNDIHWRATR